MKRWTFREPKSHKGATLDPNSVILPGDDREALRLLIRRVYALENQIESFMPADPDACICGCEDLGIDGPDDRGFYRVVCYGCGNTGPGFKDPAAAIRGWDRARDQ